MCPGLPQHPTLVLHIAQVTVTSTARLTDSLLLLLLGNLCRTHKQQEDRKEDKAMEEAKYDSKDKHLEECEEGVRRGAAQEDQGEEGGDSPIHDGGSNVDHSSHSSLPLIAPGQQEGMADVDAVVDAQPNGEDNVDAGDDINGDAPEVKKANNVSECEDNGEDNQETDLDVGEEQEDHSSNAGQGQEDVPPQLMSNDLIRLPSSIDLNMQY